MRERVNWDALRGQRQLRSKFCIRIRVPPPATYGPAFLPTTKGAEPRYIVWYIDDKDKPTEGETYKEREDAQSEFDRRV